MTDHPFHPDRAEEEEARLALPGAHVVVCSACRYAWVCACSIEPCPLGGHMDDDCALAYLEASGGDEEPIAWIEVEVRDEGLTRIRYEDGRETHREPVAVAG